MGLEFIRWLQNWRSPQSTANQIDDEPGHLCNNN